jgi:hypothetical protein
VSASREECPDMIKRVAVFVVVLSRPKMLAAKCLAVSVTRLELLAQKVVGVSE